MLSGFEKERIKESHEATFVTAIPSLHPRRAGPRRTPRRPNPRSQSLVVDCVHFVLYDKPCTFPCSGSSRHDE